MPHLCPNRSECGSMCYNASDPLLPGEISKRLHLTFHILMFVLLLNSVQLSDPRVLPDFHGHPPFLLMTCKYIHVS